MTIERIKPLVTIEQVTELVKVASAAKTKKLEYATALALQCFLMPPMIVGNEQMAMQLKDSMIEPGRIIIERD